MMKKSIFAVAVASVLTLGAAQAETVLYGSIRYDYESKKVQKMDPDKSGFKKLTSNRVSNLNDAGSRIGLKGSEDLGNNNAVIYNLEWGFDGMIQDEGKDSKWTTRKAILGLTGDWGTVTAGRQDNPFKVTIVDDTVTDDFNGGNVISAATQRAMTTNLMGVKNVLATKENGKFAENLDGDYYVDVNKYADALNSAKFSRVGKVIAYTTPDFAGFQANAALMMDDSLYLDGTNNSKNVDLWTINAKYAYDLGANGTILAKAGYLQGKMSDNNKSKMWGLMLGYGQDAFKVSASYADGNHKLPNDIVKEERGVKVWTGNGPKVKSKGWDVGASFSFGPNYFSTVRAAYGENHVKVEGEKDKVKSWAVGFEQKLSTRTRAWVEYGANETKFAGEGNDKKKDNVVSIGMRHDF